MDLHDLIQQAFVFDDDHLYSFLWMEKDLVNKLTIHPWIILDRMCIKLI